MVPAFDRLRRERAAGFSLIELLVVISIIGILSGIAVANYIFAKERAERTALMTDMRNLTTAIEAYHADYGMYPIRRHEEGTDQSPIAVPAVESRYSQMSALLKPVNYLSSLPVDPYETKILPPNNVLDYWDPVQMSWLINRFRNFSSDDLVDPIEMGWYLVSVGPDGYIGTVLDEGGWPRPPVNTSLYYDMQGTIYIPYDPTNGSHSWGNIYWGQLGGASDDGQRIFEYAFGLR